MKRISLATVGVLIVLIISCNSNKELKDSKNMKSKLAREITGTWTTENGEEKLVIHKGHMDYTYIPSGTVETSKYVIESFNFEKNSFFLQPMKDNKKGLLDAFENFKYYNHCLIGSIIIYDFGVKETEFRKVW